MKVKYYPPIKEEVQQEKETSEVYARDGFNADHSGTFLKAHISDDYSDKNFHTDIDVIMIYNGRKRKCSVDVKNVTDKNFNTGNYSIKYACVDFLTKPVPVYEHTYMFAFRLVEAGMLTKKFLVAWAEDVLNLNLIDYGSGYYLVSINDVKNLKETWIIEPDIE